MSKRIPTRKELDPAVCWAVEDLYPSDEAWEQDLEACKALPQELAAYEGRLSESSQTLLSYLDATEDAERKINRLYLYTHMRGDEDTANTTYQALKGRCFSFIVSLSSATAWVTPELIAIPDETLERFYAETPKLEKYRRYLDKARQSRAHILSPDEEKLLAGVSEISSGSSQIYNTFMNADLRFPDAVDSEGNAHPLTNGSYISLMSGKDQTLRKNAFQSFYGVFQSFENTLATTYNAEVKKNIFLSRARKYDNVLQSSLSPNEIPESVYHNLVDAVRQNLDKLHRYMSLRKKIMGLDELHMYDIYADMLPQSGKVIPFSQARDEVIESVKVLGKEYADVLASSFEGRWLDIYENVGKRSGAYSTGCYDVHPFMLLNHKDDLNSEFTLAHELGHSLHTWYSSKNQPLSMPTMCCLWQRSPPPAMKRC